MKMRLIIGLIIITVLLVGGILVINLITYEQDNYMDTAEQETSEWVYPGKDGKLIYKTTPQGDKIMDFSHAGYMGGGVALPVVPVKLTVWPSGGPDDSELIQRTINDVAAMPLENGFR